MGQEQGTCLMSGERIFTCMVWLYGWEKRMFAGVLDADQTDISAAASWLPVDCGAAGRSGM